MMNSDDAVWHTVKTAVDAVKKVGFVVFVITSNGISAVVRLRCAGFVEVTEVHGDFLIDYRLTWTT